MVDGRFAEIACELTGVRSPDQIRREELDKLLEEHVRDYAETESGVIYRQIYDDPVAEEEEKLQGETYEDWYRNHGRRRYG